MAARKTRGTKERPWSQDHRDKIQTSMLLNRMQDHILGKIKLDSTQVQAIGILLKKSMPDLASTDLTVKGQLEQHIIGLVTGLDTREDTVPAATPTTSKGETIN